SPEKRSPLPPPHRRLPPENLRALWPAGINEALSLTYCNLRLLEGEPTGCARHGCVESVSSLNIPLYFSLRDAEGKKIGADRGRSIFVKFRRPCTQEKVHVGRSSRTGAVIARLRLKPSTHGRPANNGRGCGR